MNTAANHLRTLIQETPWFQRLGQPEIDDEYVWLPTLAPWADFAEGDDELGRIADQMAWLPSSRDQDDPIGGRTLEHQVEAFGRTQEAAALVLEVYKTVLAALRPFAGHPALQVGPHDFTEAARGAALYAVRRAAYEAVLDKPGFWSRMIELYRAGHWPCGILPDGRVVVL